MWASGVTEKPDALSTGNTQALPGKTHSWEQPNIHLLYLLPVIRKHSNSLAHLDFLFMVIILFVRVLPMAALKKNYPKHRNIKQKGSLFH